VSIEPRVDHQRHASQRHEERRQLEGREVLQAVRSVLEEEDGVVAQHPGHLRVPCEAQPVLLVRGDLREQAAQGQADEGEHGVVEAERHDEVQADHPVGRT